MLGPNRMRAVSRALFSATRLSPSNSALDAWVKGVAERGLPVAAMFGALAMVVLVALLIIVYGTRLRPSNLRRVTQQRERHCLSRCDRGGSVWNVPVGLCEAWRSSSRGLLTVLIRCGAFVILSLIYRSSSLPLSRVMLLHLRAPSSVATFVLNPRRSPVARPFLFCIDVSNYSAFLLRVFPSAPTRPARVRRGSPNPDRLRRRRPKLLPRR